MARIITLAVASLVMLYIGIQSVAFRSDAMGDLGLTGSDQEALNMTDAVAGDSLTIVGNALPRLFILVLLLLVVGMLVLTR